MVLVVQRFENMPSVFYFIMISFSSIKHLLHKRRPEEAAVANGMEEGMEHVGRTASRFAVVFKKNLEEK